jgi:hypothetical protein
LTLRVTVPELRTEFSIVPFLKSFPVSFQALNPAPPMLDMMRRMIAPNVILELAPFEIATNGTLLVHYMDIIEQDWYALILAGH